MPVMPDGTVTGQNHSWKEHVMLHGHGSSLTYHRGSTATHNIIRRMAWWSHMLRDCERFQSDCEICIRNRHKPSPAIMHARGRSLDDRMLTHPWADVIIDVQGPLTQSRKGNRYLLSYQCMFLKRPLLEPLRSLKRKHSAAPS